MPVEKVKVRFLKGHTVMFSTGLVLCFGEGEEVWFTEEVARRLIKQDIATPREGIRDPISRTFARLRDLTERQCRVMAGPQIPASPIVVPEKPKKGRPMSFDPTGFDTQFRRQRADPSLRGKQTEARYMSCWANENVRNSDGCRPSDSWIARRLSDLRKVR